MFSVIIGSITVLIQIHILSARNIQKVAEIQKVMEYAKSEPKK
jgi:hypothetical protein